MAANDFKYVNQTHVDESDNQYPVTKKVLNYGWDSNSLEKVRLAANASGELSVNMVNAFIPTGYDYVARSDPDTVTEVYTFKTGGAGGATIATVTVVYTDATKDIFESATRA